MDSKESPEHMDTIHSDHVAPVEDDSEVAREAVGGASSDALPPGYYRSFAFLGTLTAIWCGEVALFTSATMPFNVLSDINDDLGPDPSYVWISIVVSRRTTFCPHSSTWSDPRNSGV